MPGVTGREEARWWLTGKSLVQGRVPEVRQCGFALLLSFFKGMKFTVTPKRRCPQNVMVL